MEKIKTYTMSGHGDQGLIVTEQEFENLFHELKAVELEEDEDFREITIRIEKYYTQKQLDELPDYNG